MSADLFAAFGDAPSQQQQSSNRGPPNPQPASSYSFFDDLSNTGPTPASQTQPKQQPPRQETDASDDWGDFEGVSSSESAPVKQDLFAFQPQQPQPPVYQAQTQWQPAPVFKPKKSHDSNVLFDAEDDAGDDDDFGDFEGPASPTVAAPLPSSSTGLANLLGDLAIAQPERPVTVQNTQKPRASISRSPAKIHDRGFGSPPMSTEPPVTSPSLTKKQEESWDSFDDWEASIPTKKEGKAGMEVKASSAMVQSPSLDSATTSSRYDEAQPGELPPTNVPPPSLLLSIFPPLFADAHEKLFKPMAAQSLPMRNRLLSEPATIAYLQAYLELASVAARIIAGRKLRWKRDVHLSQGMRIGPASSRATSGMKLTGIDKSENIKEEREVSDLVRAWKEQVGRLRHVVSAANQAKTGALGAVPDVQETMPVRTLKQADGGVPARLPCMLCGLKRDERVGDADVGVIDGFGEWWVDQVNMHRGCRNFWREHKDKLRQR